jgi:hypothetical protein
LERRARNNGFADHREREFHPPPPTTRQSSRVGSLKKPSVHVHAKLLFSGFGSAMFHSRIVLQGWCTCVSLLCLIVSVQRCIFQDLTKLLEITRIIFLQTLGFLVVKGPIGACSLCTSVLLSRKSVM